MAKVIMVWHVVRVREFFKNTYVFLLLLYCVFLFVGCKCYKMYVIMKGLKNIAKYKDNNRANAFTHPTRLVKKNDFITYYLTNEKYMYVPLW